MAASALSSPATAARRREDMALFERYLRDRDPRLRTQLIERFLPLARTIAQRFARTNQPYDDVF